MLSSRRPGGLTKSEVGYAMCKVQSTYDALTVRLEDEDGFCPPSIRVAGTDGGIVNGRGIRIERPVDGVAPLVDRNYVQVTIISAGAADALRWVAEVKREVGQFSGRPSRDAHKETRNAPSLRPASNRAALPWPIGSHRRS